MKCHLAKAYIVQCPAKVITEKRQWSLPHFPVVRETKETTKVRMVFDAAAKQAGESLNDHMFAGLKLQQELVKVLLRFCLQPIALVGDIQEMFLQGSLKEEDQKYVRFLWCESPQHHVSIYQFKRLVFGSRASPYLASRAIQEIERQFGERYETNA